MKENFIQKKVVLDLKYLKSECDFNKNYFLGGVEDPLYMEELSFDIYKDMTFDFNDDSFKENGKMVLELAGTERALYEFGKYLINISLYETLDPDFHEHFDDLLDSDNKQNVNLIIRKKKKSKN